MRVLILGGTGEARQLARALLEAGDAWVLTSLAGRVSEPTLPPGKVRVGALDAVSLEVLLDDEQIDVVIDATHPFANEVSLIAAEVTHRAGRRLIALRRPGWTEAPGDVWTRVADVTAAARSVATSSAEQVLLTTGRRDLAAFAGDAARHFLIRTVERPDEPLPPRRTLLQDRGPYTARGELMLLAEHRIDLLVTKDSGGAGTAAKLVAARTLHLPVVMIDRPRPPKVADTVGSAGAAAAAVWKT